MRESEQVADTHNSAITDSNIRHFLHPGTRPFATLAAWHHHAANLSTKALTAHHCVSRCVRRAFQCGFDALSGRGFGQRKDWVEARLMELAECFAVGLCAYAVMSNHLHLVAHVVPAVAASWSAEDAAQRWLRLFPVRERGKIDYEACRLRAQVLAADPIRIAEIRQRRSSLSWFMRYLSEPIARRANRENGCTGRYREG